METTITNSIHGELLKTRKSSAFWLVIIGAVFIPCIMMVNQFVYPEKTAIKNSASDFWQGFFNGCWESMSIFLLPMGIILVCSLLTQLEFRNNSWKQVLVSPQPLYFIYTAKLIVIIIMLLLFFVIFNASMYFSVLIPALLHYNIVFPNQSFPFMFYLNESLLYFIDCLPIIALQFLLSLHFKNFMIPVGIGFICMITSLFAISWEYGHWFPYTYTAYNYFRSINTAEMTVNYNIHLYATIYFVVITFVSYFLFKNRKATG